MKKVKKCPVCGGRESTKLFDVKAFPYFTAPVKKGAKAVINHRYPLKKLEDRLLPLACRKCGHIYLGQLPDEKLLEELYKKYYSYPSAMMGSFIPERDNAFLKVFHDRISKLLPLRRGSVLEIGCYDGYVIYKLKKQGYKVRGCDPSEGADIGKKFGLEIEKCFFDPKKHLKEKQRYDAVVSRHFLEHLHDPSGFLKDAAKILCAGGKLVFEVPNAVFALKNGNPSIFSFQHLQYFSPASIGETVKRSGLVLNELIDTGENLIAVCGREGSQVPADRKKVLELCKEFRNKLKGNISSFKRTAKHCSSFVVWGAGGFTGSMLKLFGVQEKKLRIAVDSDPKKWGMKFLQHDFDIKSPEVLRGQKEGCVLISSMYSGQIMQKLRALGYKGKVISLYPAVQVMQGGSK